MNGNTTEQKNLLSVDDAARFSAVSQSTVRRWIKSEGLQHYRAGKQIRIDPDDLLKFLRSGTSSPPL